jgi:hypothetical protein
LIDEKAACGRLFCTQVSVLLNRGWGLALKIPVWQSDLL